MPSFIMGDERGAMGIEQVAVVSGLIMLGALGLYRAAGWIDGMMAEVGASSTAYAVYSPPGVSDVTEADFRTAMRAGAGN